MTGQKAGLVIRNVCLISGLEILDTRAIYLKTSNLTSNPLRGHIEDIMDISWSPDGKMIVSGSIDNSVIVWEVKTGKLLLISI